MKEIKNKKSLYWKILQVNVIPVFLLTIIITSFSAHSFSKALNQEVKKGLMDISATILTLYDHLHPGDYAVVEQDGAIYLLKGEHQINGDFSIIDSIKEDTGVDITFFYNDVRVITTLYQNDKRIIGTKVNAVVTKDVLNSKKPAFYSSVEIENEQHFAYYAPVINSDGSCIGMLSVAKSTKEVAASKMASIFPIVFLGLAGMLIAGVFSFRFSKNLIRAIGKIEEFLRKVAKGNLNDSLDYEVSKREDELGEMGRNAVKMQKSLIELVEKDALTDLYNRRYGDKKLKEAYRNKRNQNIDFQLVLGDIDHFKAVNDTYGHECGDMVLAEMARIMKKYTKDRGFAARWGGEEFLLVFTDCSYTEARERIENIMQEVRAAEVICEENKVRVTMTFGISQGVADDLDEMLRDADKKLYQGKKNGRDRIV